MSFASMEEMCDEMRIQKAYSVAMETNKITPLLKEELRLSILSKRLAEGKDELEVKFDRPKKYELTDDEVLKRDRRRRQNRDAARKFRKNKKSKASSLLETVEKQQVLKKELEQMIEGLTTEKKNLLIEIHDHLSLNPCSTSNNELQQYETSVTYTNRSSVEHDSQEIRLNQIIQHPHSHPSLPDSDMDVRNIAQDLELSPPSYVDDSTLGITVDTTSPTACSIINDNDLVIILSDTDIFSI